MENNKLLYDSYSNYKKHENIEYAEKKDYKGRHHKLTLDLFEPEPADDLVKNRPVLLLAHGGGFFAGSKSDMTKFAEQFVKKGYVVISIDYRIT